MNVIIRLRNIINDCVKRNGAHYQTFGILGLFLFPVFYYVTAHYQVANQGNFSLRVVGALICLPLALHQYWPKNWRVWLPIYWYIVLLYCLPFFFTVIILENRTANPTWLIGLPFLLLWLMLVVDGLSFIILFTLGTILGFIVVDLDNQIQFYISRTDYLIILIQFLILIGITMYIMKTNQNFKEVQNKTLAIKPIAAGIAHEIRTPLASISAGANGIKNYLPILVEGYQQAKQHNLSVGFIREIHIKQLNETLDKVVRETLYANTIIDMMLIQVNHSLLQPKLFYNLAIVECVSAALNRYPFIADSREKLITWDTRNDFIFYGDKMLFIHVIFNLIKNAIYYIAVANKGHIYIWLENHDETNSLHFKDTGSGIAENVIEHIFTNFYTTNPNGSGIGLAFCKSVIESMGGKIRCDSVDQEYTEFVITLPKVKADPN
jgi:two-component system CAI-1 autoinducer sensor kinase/phosphatase CqsS